MTWDDNEDPPRFARAGAERWMRRKVEMNGAEPCASFVRIPVTVVRGAELAAGGVAVVGSSTELIVLSTT